MPRPRWPSRAWAIAGVAALAVVLATIVVAAGAPSPGGITRSDRLATVDDGDPPGPELPTSTAADPSASTTTTTMPPRAQPVRLAPTRPGPLLGTVIVVDPGHNGLNYRYVDVRRPGSPDGDGPLCNTAGASTAGGLDEYVIVWNIGERLATLLRSLGAEVILTHPDTDGFGPCADERGLIARDAGATVLVSLHADGSSSGSGFHVIHPAPKPTLDPAGVAESARLAGLVRDELLVIGGRPANYVGTDGVQQRDDLANLNNANRPSVLIELGNLRHPLDAEMLADSADDDRIARALARAISRFAGRVVDPALLSPDLDGDGLADFLIGAPQTTTTTTTVPGTPVAGAPLPGASPPELPQVPTPGSAAPSDPLSTTVAPPGPPPEPTVAPAAGAAGPG